MIGRVEQTYTHPCEYLNIHRPARSHLSLPRTVGTVRTLVLTATMETLTAIVSGISAADKVIIEVAATGSNPSNKGMCEG
jgi:hypothetical protein